MITKVTLCHLADSNKSYVDVTPATKSKDCWSLTVTYNISVVEQDKAGAKARLGNNQVKETVQEYIAGSETVTDDPITRDYVVMRARLMAAK